MYLAGNAPGWGLDSCSRAIEYIAVGPICEGSVPAGGAPGVSRQKRFIVESQRPRWNLLDSDRIRPRHRAIVESQGGHIAATVGTGRPGRRPQGHIVGQRKQGDHHIRNKLTVLTNGDRDRNRSQAVSIAPIHGPDHDQNRNQQNQRENGPERSIVGLLSTGRHGRCSSPTLLADNSPISSSGSKPPEPLSSAGTGQCRFRRYTETDGGPGSGHRGRRRMESR
ncbi:MAG: hypothetical protein Ct9H300mP1_15670 [Planctomycetaceae bacterium]|nr:MAG: hypothetical protein Ct9H300mP1_15670 [Planctomycetaceae bacterium]